MDAKTLRDLPVGTRLQWNRGDVWIDVIFEGPSSRRDGWFNVRHERMGWEHSGPPEDLRVATACPACGRPTT